MKISYSLLLLLNWIIYYSNFVDFPAVNWVLQMDCPEDVNAYIHRAGRTARFQSGGESLLVLLPSEEGIIEKLKQCKIPINMIRWDLYF